MSEAVPATDIEQIVGVPRHPTEHWGRAVSASQTVFVLHSAICRLNTPDLRDCPFSRALDLGIDVREWVQDQPTALAVHDGHLAPRRVDE